MKRFFSRRVVVVALALAGLVAPAADATDTTVDKCRPELGYCIKGSKPGKPIGYGGGCGYVEVTSGDMAVQAHVLPCPGPVIW